MKSNDLQYPVLVVDDEADIRDLMEMTLMKMGLRVETAVGVDDAKEKIGKQRLFAGINGYAYARRFGFGSGAAHQ